MAKPYSKSAKSNISGFGSDLGSSIAQGANLETMKYQQQAALPNQHENDAQLFSGLSKAFSAPGDRPRGFWRNLGAGAMEGLEYGARSNSIAERKENYGKYADEMNWFQQVNNALIDRNERAAEAEEEMAQIRPYATAGLEISYSGMPYEQGNQNMRALVDQLKINNPKFRGDYVGYVPNSPIVNIRDENGNITAVSLSSFTGEDIVKRVQDNYIERQKIAKDEKALELKYPSSQYDGSNSMDINGTEYKVSDLSKLTKTARGKYEERVNLALDAIPKNNQALQAIDDMETVFKRNPKIANSWVQWLDQPNGDTFMTWMARNVNSWFDGQSLVDQEILNKAAADLNLDVILGISGKTATDILKQEIKKAAPNGRLTAKSFGEISKKWKKAAHDKNRLATAKFEAMSQGNMLFENPASAKGKKPNPETEEQDDSPLAALGRKVQ